MYFKQRPSLLLVDDDKTYRYILNRTFVKCGFVVIIAPNVHSAISIAEANPPEYAVIDLKKPNITGPALASQLKALHAATHVVMLTEYASITSAIRAITAHYRATKGSNLVTSHFI